MTNDDQNGKLRSREKYLQLEEAKATFVYYKLCCYRIRIDGKLSSKLINGSDCEVIGKA